MSRDELKPFVALAQRFQEQADQDRKRSYNLGGVDAIRARSRAYALVSATEQLDAVIRECS